MKSSNIWVGMVLAFSILNLNPLFISPSFSASGSGSDGTRGGGDDLGLEISTLAKDVVQELREKYTDRFPELNLAHLDDMARRARIVVVETPLSVVVAPLEEKLSLAQESFAVNDPDKQIIYVNRARWNAQKDENTRRALVLHELLSLMGVEKTGLYTLSSRYNAHRIIETSEAKRETQGALLTPSGRVSEGATHPQAMIEVGAGTEYGWRGVRLLIEVNHQGWSPNSYSRFFVVETVNGLETLSSAQGMSSTSGTGYTHIRVTPIDLSPIGGAQKDLLHLQLFPITHRYDVQLGELNMTSMRIIGASVRVPFIEDVEKGRTFVELGLSGMGVAEASIAKHRKAANGVPMEGYVEFRTYAPGSSHYAALNFGRSQVSEIIADTFSFSMHYSNGRDALVFELGGRFATSIVSSDALGNLTGSGGGLVAYVQMRVLLGFAGEK